MSMFLIKSLISSFGMVFNNLSEGKFPCSTCSAGILYPEIYWIVFLETIYQNVIPNAQISLD